MNTITIYDRREDEYYRDDAPPLDFIGPLDDQLEWLVVPATREVCGRCNGTGVHDHPAFANGFGADEMGEDPDFREDYMRGVYDVKCSRCCGNRVVDEPDWERMTERQRTLADEYYREENAYRSEAEAERRMGA